MDYESIGKGYVDVGEPVYGRHEVIRDTEKSLADMMSDPVIASLFLLPKADPKNTKAVQSGGKLFPRTPEDTDLQD